MKKIKELRVKNNLTQVDLSRLSGLTKRTIINYETGNSYPKKREVYKLLAEIFKAEGHI